MVSTARESSPRPAYRTLWRHLPGRTLSAAVLIQNHLWLIVDPDKADLDPADAVTVVTVVLGAV